jgi:hypothetical protein
MLDNPEKTARLLAALRKSSRWPSPLGLPSACQSLPYLKPKLLWKHECETASARCDALGAVTVPTWLAGERRGELAPLGFGA